MIRINLLGLPKPRKRAPVVTLEGGRPLVILVVVLAAVGAAQYWRYHNLEAEGLVLDQQVQQLQEEKARLARIRTEYDTFSRQKEALTRRIEIIEGLKARQSGPVNLLAMLASTVNSTDALWLTSFEQTGQRITIEGVALNVQAVADFLTSLKNSQAFTELEMQETYQDNTVKETTNFVFTMTGQLVAPEMPAMPPGDAPPTT